MPGASSGSSRGLAFSYERGTPVGHHHGLGTGQAPSSGPGIWGFLENFTRTSIHHEYDFTLEIGANPSKMRLTARMPWGRIVFTMNTRRFLHRYLHHLISLRTGSWMGPPQEKRAPRVGIMALTISRLEVSCLRYGIWTLMRSTGTSLMISTYLITSTGTLFRAKGLFGLRVYSEPPTPGPVFRVQVSRVGI